MAQKTAKTKETPKTTKAHTSLATTSEVSEASAANIKPRAACIDDLPTPEELAKYEKVIPGGAERILEIAEQNARHQRASEERALSAEIRTTRISQAIVCLLALVACILGGMLLLNGSELAGLIIILIDAAALVGITLYQQRAE